MSQEFNPKDRSGVSLRTITHLLYGLFALGVLTSGVFAVAVLAAVVLAYVKRPDAAGTLYAPHFDWLLSTFWWALLWLLLSAIATLIFVGWLTGLIALVWVMLRLIRGWLALCESRPPAT